MVHYEMYNRTLAKEHALMQELKELEPILKETSAHLT